LWDASYTETSWITKHSTHGPIRLLPRVREKIEKHYPGTPLAITEYYYGGGVDISGALAEADVLGIFGREGVFAAALWHVGKTDDRFIHAAVAMFRNYDGQGGHFGDTSLAATTSDVEHASVYASLDAQDRVVIVALNKSQDSLPVEIVLKGAPPSGNAKVYQLTKTRPQPVRIDDVPAGSAGLLRCELPAQSVSTLVLDRSEKAN
jgi:O-glycosyl hydrolase